MMPRVTKSQRQRHHGKRASLLCGVGMNQEYLVSSLQLKCLLTKLSALGRLGGADQE